MIADSSERQVVGQASDARDQLFEAMAGRSGFGEPGLDLFGIKRVGLSRRRHAARQIEKVLNSAVANAEYKGRESNEPVDVDTLYVKHAIINEGPKLKRFTPAAMGRATPIQKRTSHVEIVLGPRAVAPRPKAKAASGGASAAVAKPAKPAAKGGEKAAAKGAEKAAARPGTRKKGA